MVIQKRELENNQTTYETCLKGFSFFMSKKIKGKFFSTGSREALSLWERHWTTEFTSLKPCFFYKCALESPGKFGQNTTELAILNLKKKGLWAFFCALHFYWVSQIFSFLLMLPIITETYKEGSSIEKDGNNCLRKKLTKLSILVHII